MTYNITIPMSYTIQELRALKSEEKRKEEDALVHHYTNAIKRTVLEEAKYGSYTTACFWLVDELAAKTHLVAYTGLRYHWPPRYIKKTSSPGTNAMLKRPIPYELADRILEHVYALFPDALVEIMSSSILLCGDRQEFLTISW